jgi:hypothetical protein
MTFEEFSTSEMFSNCELLIIEEGMVIQGRIWGYSPIQP